LPPPRRKPIVRKLLQDPLDSTKGLPIHGVNEFHPRRGDPALLGGWGARRAATPDAGRGAYRLLDQVHGSARHLGRVGPGIASRS